jgi:NADH-quinone oxidoreductase subunit F
VDSVLGQPTSVWDGGERSAADDHVAYGGFSHVSDRRNLLLPALHAVQSAIGWVSHGAINYIAERLPVSPAEAFGVADFYDLIATSHRPARVAWVCDDIACRARGVDSTLDSLTTQLGSAGEVHDDVMWMRSPCLGQCEKGSAAFVQVAGGSDVAVAPASAEDIIGVLRAEVPRSAVKPTDSIPGAALLSRRSGSIHEHIVGEGFIGLRTALRMGSQAVIDEMEASGLRGRGGASFPAAIKWRAVAAADGPRYVVCNADESEPGTFKDRVLMEADPYGLIEALTIAAYAVGANRGYIYIRGEYPIARRRLADAIDETRQAGFLGGDIAGSEFSFDIELRSGAGAYICGEETALFNSIEGYRGEPRQKPPFPTEAGLFGRPTLVNNVETLMNVLAIVDEGGAAFAEIGTAESTGPKLFCVSGNVVSPGVYEVPFGATTRELISLAGGIEGSLRAVLVGGAAGTFIAGEGLDVPLTFEATRAAGISLGSGVVMVFNTDVDMTLIAGRIAHFFAEESCGLCIPCRVGTVRQEESLARIRSRSSDVRRELDLLSELDGVLRDASICGLGQFATVAIQSAIDLRLIGDPA